MASLDTSVVGQTVMEIQGTASGVGYDRVLVIIVSDHRSVEDYDRLRRVAQARLHHAEIDDLMRRLNDRLDLDSAWHLPERRGPRCPCRGLDPNCGAHRQDRQPYEAQFPTMPPPPPHAFAMAQPLPPMDRRLRRGFLPFRLAPRGWQGCNWRHPRRSR